MQTLNRVPTRVLVKGLNWSGSGAAVDLLREHDGLIQIPGGFEKIAPAGYSKLGEFNDFRGIGCVGDQLVPREKMRHPSRIMALAKAKQRSAGWQLALILAGFIRRGRVMQTRSIASQSRQLSFSGKCLERLAVAFEQNDDAAFRLRRAQLWIDELVGMFGEKASRGVIFDQPIFFGQHNDFWPVVFGPYKLLIVHRDPRDQAAERVKLGRASSIWNGHLGSIYGWGPEAAVDFLMDVAIARNKAVDQTLSFANPGCVMLINFEKMVLDYEESKKRIQDFLGLTDRDHIRPKKFFKPEWSKRNIGVHKGIEVPASPSKMEQLLEWYHAHLEE